MKRKPTLVTLPGKFYGQGSLMGYSPWGHKQSDTTEYSVFGLLVSSKAYNGEKAMATHSSTLAWKIPWVEEPGRLQSMGLLRV